MNTVIVTSPKEFMNASIQPETTPGRISGSVTRRKTVAALAPSDTAACSMRWSMP